MNNNFKINELSNTFNKNQSNNNDYSKIHLIIACENCKAKFLNENELLYHYQICINQIINENNFANQNQLIAESILLNDNPLNPDNLSTYINWEYFENPSTGVGIWMNKGIIQFKSNFLY